MLCRALDLHRFFEITYVMEKREHLEHGMLRVSQYVQLLENSIKRISKCESKLAGLRKVRWDKRQISISIFNSLF
jgi:hypothetical protein